MHYSLCDMIADIVQNAVESCAGHISLECIQEQKWLSVFINDNGVGMTEEELKAAGNPFNTNGHKHPCRKINLGIPFLYQTAEQTHSYCSIESKKGQGTAVTAKFNLTDIDIPPAGSFSDLFYCVLIFDGEYDMDIHRKNTVNGLEYRLNRKELRSALGGNLNWADSLILLKKYIESLETEIR